MRDQCTSETSFIETVKMNIGCHLSVLKKEELRRKKLVKVSKMLDSSKEHPGHVTPKSNDVHMSNLNEKKLLAELASRCLISSDGR